MLLSEETQCFAFLAGHESFAAAEGAIGIARSANKVRTQPLRVIFEWFRQRCAQIISRINGFTYVQTQFDYYSGDLNRTGKSIFKTERANVRCLVQMMCVRAWQSCIMKALMLLSLVIQLTQLVFSTSGCWNL